MKRRLSLQGIDPQFRAPAEKVGWYDEGLFMRYLPTENLVRPARFELTPLLQRHLANPDMPTLRPCGRSAGNLELQPGLKRDHSRRTIPA